MLNRILPLLAAVCLLVVSLSVSASAAVFDPYDYGSVSIDGDNEVVTIRNEYSSWFWRARFDGASSNIAISSGPSISYVVTMAQLDNTIVEAFPFGYQGMASSAGIPSGSRIEGDFDFGGSVVNATQSFSVRAVLYLITYDSNGSQINSVALESETHTGLTDGFSFGFRPSFDASSLAGSEYWAFVLGLDFSEVANESDTVKITVGASSGYFLISIPYSQLYQLQQQGAKTNKLLDQIDKQMAANGEKLDDVIAQGQANGEKLDGIQDSLDDTHQMWEDTINGTVPPHDPEGSDVVDDFHESENELWGSVSGGLDELDDAALSAGGSIASLAVSFAFVTSFLNVVWGLPPIESLLHISLTLGATASIIGLGAGFYRRASRHGGKS